MSLTPIPKEMFVPGRQEADQEEASWIMHGGGRASDKVCRFARQRSMIETDNVEFLCASPTTDVLNPCEGNIYNCNQCLIFNLRLQAIANGTKGKTG